jgi:hypothetical protein
MPKIEEECPECFCFRDHEIFIRAYHPKSGKEVLMCEHIIHSRGEAAVRSEDYEPYCDLKRRLDNEEFRSPGSLA